jgi:hypothetical protein
MKDFFINRKKFILLINALLIYYEVFQLKIYLNFYLIIFL